MKAIKKLFLYGVTASLLLSVLVLSVNYYVSLNGKKNIVDKVSFIGAPVAIVLGAFVMPDGKLCDMLADRVDTAIELYKQGKVTKILMTGDHGQKSYDEVNSMRRYAEARGVPTQDIFMDHAGFSTYDSMYRAKEVFMVDSAVIVTQDFHLPRAVFTARKLGLQAVGLNADRHIYPKRDLLIYQLREIPARIKAFVQLYTGAKPTFLGEAIPITGDGKLTHDMKD